MVLVMACTQEPVEEESPELNPDNNDAVVEENDGLDDDMDMDDNMENDTEPLDDNMDNTTE